MKLPFHTIIGPIYKRNKRSLKTFCATKSLYFSSLYTPLLGFVGMVLSLVDLYRIIRCGSVLPIYLSKERKSGGIVSPEVERDLKVISLVLSLECYLMIIMGYLMLNPTLFLPFLFLHALIGSLELFSFLIRLLAGTTCLTKYSVIVAVFYIYNWCSVLCSFYKMLNSCDF